MDLWRLVSAADLAQAAGFHLVNEQTVFVAQQPPWCSFHETYPVVHPYSTEEQVQPLSKP